MNAGHATGERFALVVDDNARAAAVSCAMLEACGWQVDRAHDGFEAILRCRERTYDALVLDYRLPGMDGAEVLAWVQRNMDVCPDVVIVSSECSEFLRRRFEGLGVRAILSKPLAAEALVRALAA